MAKAKPNEIAITRIYDAPVQAVWDAWTDPNKASKWWGPRGFTITTHSKDLRKGGHWIYTMHGPDKVDYPNKTTYHEVITHQKLVYDHGAGDEKPPLFRVTVTFEDMGGRTKMDMTMALATEDAAKETAKFVKKAGGNTTWDRLAEFLCEELTGKQPFVINHSFAAPIDVVFDAWTNPKHLIHWLPPTGFDMKYLHADIRKGGSSMYCMSGGAFKMYGKAQYHEISKPTRLVYTQQFCDEKGNMARHPGAPTWPELMRTTVTFTKEDFGETRVTVIWECEGHFTTAELATFVKERAGMTAGWTGSFTKFEDYLSKI